jgi:hypothetical protein
MPDMTKLTYTITRLCFTALFLLANACIPQTPIPIYVTPTQPGETSTPVPTLEVEAVDVTALVESPEGPQDQLSPEPTLTFLGPVIGPDYTPPASSTLRPRPTAIPTETTTPAATSTATPPTPSQTPEGPRPTALPDFDASQMGVQVHTLLEQSDWDEVLRLTEQLDVGWAKVQIDWSLLQPNGPDDISVDFRRQELYVENLDSRGMKVLVSIAKAPAWARSNRSESGPPDDPQALANFLTLMLNEFGNVIDAVEIWNEPNLLREWQGQALNGASYMRYFAPAYQAINEYSQRSMTDPRFPREAPVIVVTAGLAPTGTSDFSVDDRDYLQQMYNAGLANYPDVAIGSHPFSWGNPPDVRCCNAVEGQGWDDDPHFFFSHTIEDYRNIMVNNGHANNRIWVTEFGWATWDRFPGDAPEEWMRYNDQWSQAHHTLRAFQIGQSTDYIGPMMLWNMNFGWLASLVENRDERAAYSLLTRLQPQQERPLYWMLYDTTHHDLQLERYDAD